MFVIPAFDIRKPRHRWPGDGPSTRATGRRRSATLRKSMRMRMIKRWPCSAD